MPHGDRYPPSKVDNLTRCVTPQNVLRVRDCGTIKLAIHRVGSVRCSFILLFRGDFDTGGKCDLFLVCVKCGHVFSHRYKQKMKKHLLDFLCKSFSPLCTIRMFFLGSKLSVLDTSNRHYLPSFFYH